MPAMPPRREKNKPDNEQVAAKQQEPVASTEEKTILFLSTKKQAQETVKEQAIECGMPYIVNK